MNDLDSDFIFPDQYRRIKIILFLNCKKEIVTNRRLFLEKLQKCSRLQLSEITALQFIEIVELELKAITHHNDLVDHHSITKI